MPLPTCFDNFIKKAPVCVAARGILERVFAPTALDQVFADHAQLGYTKSIAFSTCVDLMGQVVLNTAPSLYAAYVRLRTDLSAEDLFSHTALYNKVNKIEPSVAEGLVAYSAAQASPVIESLGAMLPPLLPGYRTRILDGNHFSATEHRIEELRTIWDAPLPGKALVVFDPQRALIEKVVLCEDGHAQERSLIDPVLDMVRPKDLWIADRNFCTLKMLFRIKQEDGYFVIRQHGALVGTLKGPQTEPARCSTGMTYEQQILLTDPESGKQHAFRRITVELDEPTRDGDRVIHILTNLSKSAASATKVAELYRSRWTIESAFNEVTMTLDCEIKTLGYPRAALLAFSLALVVYNAVSILKASLRAVLGEETVQKKISPYYITLEVSSTYQGMMIAIPEPRWAIFRKLNTQEFVALLLELASQINPARYPKHMRGPKKKPPEKQQYHNGGHASTHKLINGIK